MSLPEGPAEEKKKDDELLDTSADDESKEVTAPPYLLLDKGSDDYDMKKAPSEDAAASTNKVMVGSASIREVFSFARTRKTKLFMAGSFAAAIVSGATMPGTYKASIMIPKLHCSIKLLLCILLLIDCISRIIYLIFFFHLMLVNIFSHGLLFCPGI